MAIKSGCTPVTICSCLDLPFLCNKNVKLGKTGELGRSNFDSHQKIYILGGITASKTLREYAAYISYISNEREKKWAYTKETKALCLTLAYCDQAAIQEACHVLQPIQEVASHYMFLYLK